MTIKLFLKKEDIKTIEQISKLLKSIKRDIERCIVYKDSNSHNKHWDKLEIIKKEQFRKELPELINKIQTSLRKSYNVV